MKIMIASDIHGSGFYAEQLVKAFEREQPEKLLLLGDLLYHGPRNALPKEYDPPRVAELLGKIADRIMCVQGNCDADVDQMVLPFPVLVPSMLLYAGGRMILATHGHVWGENTPPKLHKGDILLNGHTHVPSLREHETFTYVNPGSVSIPKEDSWHGYMMLDDRALVWKTLSGEEKMTYTL